MAVADVFTTRDYELLHDLVSRRASIRKLKSDPLPEGAVERILEVAHWAMSGANSQPWEYVVVTNPDVKQQLWDAYRDINTDYVFWMEQQRVLELRHPSFQIYEDLDSRHANMPGWAHAPALIVLLGDGRRQWGTIQGAHTFGRMQSHLTDGLANTATLIHLAAAALGFGTQHTTIHIEEPFKHILGVPDLLCLHDIIPVGYPAIEPKVGVRRELNEMVHHDHYDRSKYMSNQRVIEYLYELRKKTIPKVAVSHGTALDGTKLDS